MEDPRQRALRLIQCYGYSKDERDAQTKIGVQKLMLGDMRQEQDVTIGNSNNNGNTGKFIGASPGFSVLDLTAREFQEVDPQIDEQVYQDLRDFVEGKRLRPASRCLRDQQRKERKQVENKLIEAGILEPKEEVLPEKDFVKKNMLSLDLEAVRKQKMKDKKVKERKKKASNDRKQSRQRSSPRSPHSPRNLNPTILDPGHHIQVAWNGVPEKLQKMYYREVAPSLTEHKIEEEKQEHEPTITVEDQKQQEEEKPKQQEEVEEERPQQQVEVEETPEEKRARALKFANEHTKSVQAANHRKWLQKRALQHRNKRVAPATAMETPSNESKKPQGTDRKVYPRYKDLCQLARAQVLAERAELQKEMGARRDAAIILQRQLRGYVQKVKFKRRLDLTTTKELKKTNHHAKKLQKVFRGYKTRIMVTRLITRQQEAAKSIQKLIRKSYVKKNEQTLRAEKQLIKLKHAAEQSVADRDHFAWVQRVLSRTKMEEESAPKALSKLEASNGNNVTDWIRTAPKVTVGGEDDASSIASSEANLNLDSPRPLSPREFAQKHNIPRLCLDKLDQSKSSKTEPEKKKKGGNFDFARKRKIVPLADSTLSTSIPSPVLEKEEESDGTGMRMTFKTHSTMKKPIYYEKPRQDVMAKEKPRSMDEVLPDEYGPINQHIASQLSQQVGNVHGRVTSLSSTIRKIAVVESQLPSLRFSETKKYT